MKIQKLSDDKFMVVTGGRSHHHHSTTVVVNNVRVSGGTVEHNIIIAGNFFIGIHVHTTHHVA